MTPPATVLFDGMCNLCDASVRFILANDPAGRFRFAPLESAAGVAALAPFARDPHTVASIIVIDAEGVYERSDAALRIVRDLRRPWRWFAFLGAIPRWFRDPLYDAVARNRYRLFGRRSTCALPTPAQRARFLDGEMP